MKNDKGILGKDYEKKVGNIFITPPEESLEDYMIKLLNGIGIETPNPQNTYYPYWFISYREFLESLLVLLKEDKLPKDRLKELLTRSPEKKTESKSSA